MSIHEVAEGLDQVKTKITQVPIEAMATRLTALEATGLISAIRAYFDEHSTKPQAEALALGLEARKQAGECTGGILELVDPYSSFRDTPAPQCIQEAPRRIGDMISEIDLAMGSIGCLPKIVEKVMGHLAAIEACVTEYNGELDYIVQEATDARAFGGVAAQEISTYQAMLGE